MTNDNTQNIIEITESAADRAVRENREAEEAKKRQEQRWTLMRQMDTHMKRIALCLDMLVDTEVKDRSALASLAQRLRAEYLAALDLVPEHKAVDGSAYDFSLRPFEHLYK
jgi:GAF domain-containing protein